MTDAGGVPAAPGPVRPGWAGWLPCALALLYALLIHYGVGPDPQNRADEWYTPSGFMNDWEILNPLLDPPALAIVSLWLPALALAAATFALAGSAVACALAASSAVATLLFLYYSFQFPFAWEFFHWRGSAVMIGVGLAVGCAVAAPRLAGSWLRLGWALRLLVFVLLCLVVVAIVCNVTGTDPELRFAISPWPAVPVFGMETGAAIVASWLAGMALACAGASASGTRAAGALLLGLATPAIAIGALVAFGVFPFAAGPGTLAVLSLVGAPLVLLAVFLPARRPGGRPERARRLGAGAALVGVPLLLALALARAEYARTRAGLAQEIIDALQSYYDSEEIYPDELEELVASGRLDEIPEPAIGFHFLYDGSFRYQSFGTSYLLEFDAPRWVQCAYAPPYEDEDDREEGDDDAVSDEGGEEDDGSLGGAWSCPSEPPELW